MISKTKIRGTIQNGLEETRIPCTGCVSNTVFLAHGNSKGEETDTITMQENSKKSGRKERGHEGKSHKQGLTSAKDY